MGSSRDGLSSVVTERRYAGGIGGEDGLGRRGRGGLFQNDRRADTSSAVSYVSNHSPPTPAPINTRQKSEIGRADEETGDTKTGTGVRE